MSDFWEYHHGGSFPDTPPLRQVPEICLLSKELSDVRRIHSYESWYHPLYDDRGYVPGNHRFHCDKGGKRCIQVDRPGRCCRVRDMWRMPGEEGYSPGEDDDRTGSGSNRVRVMHNQGKPNRVSLSPLYRHAGLHYQGRRSGCQDHRVDPLTRIFPRQISTPRPFIAPGDTQVSPSLRIPWTGLLLSQERGGNQDIALRWGSTLTSREQASGSFTKRVRGADERQRATEQGVGGRGPPRNEWERVVEVLAAGGSA